MSHRFSYAPGRLARRVRRAVGGELLHRLSRRTVRLPEDFAPTLSFSFDDFPQSAVDKGRPVLESAGMRATWYLASGIVGQDSPVGVIASGDSIRALHAAGHEIGDHTRRHIAAEGSTAAAFARDLADNRAGLAAIVPGLVTNSFSYPFGSLTLGAKRAAMATAQTCRTTAHGIARGIVDFALLPANRLYEPDALAAAHKLIEELERSGGWAILYTHDVTGSPSPWGCTPATFAAVVEAVARAGIRVRTVGEVASSVLRGEA